MITPEFVHAPATEEPVDTRLGQVPSKDDDDGEDALSLCNLSLYCDAADNSFANDVASPSSSSSSSLDHDDFFEFSSTGDSDSSSDLRSDDRRIVFCGKLIPHRESPPNPPPKTTPENKISPLQTGRGSQKSTSRRNRSPTVRRRKCRWYLMAFGLARVPTEMTLSEMRTRQSRGSRDGGGDIVRSGDCGDKSKAKGLFGLLKAVGIGHRRRADAVVKATLGCVRA